MASETHQTLHIRHGRKERKHMDILGYVVTLSAFVALHTQGTPMDILRCSYLPGGPLHLGVVLLLQSRLLGLGNTSR